MGLVAKLVAVALAVGTVSVGGPILMEKEPRVAAVWDAAKQGDWVGILDAFADPDVSQVEAFGQARGGALVDVGLTLEYTGEGVPWDEGSWSTGKEAIQAVVEVLDDADGSMAEGRLTAGDRWRVDLRPPAPLEAGSKHILVWVHADGSQPFGIDVPDALPDGKVQLD